MSYKFQKGDAKLGGAVEASALTGTLNPASLADADTDDIGEGSSNLYYTDARSRAAVSVTDAGGDGSMAYNSSTGVLTYTGPSASEVRAHFSGAAGVDLSSGAISVNVDDSSLEISGDALQVKALGVTRAMLVADAVDGTKLADDAVDSEHIVDGAVDLAHLAADSVDGTKIADDSVDSEHIAAGAIDFEHFAAGSVSGSALADAGIGNAKLLNSTISGIALGGTLGALSTGNGLSMTSYDGSAAVSDLTVSLDGSTLSVGGSGLKVADGGVTTTQLSASAVTTAKIAADAVDGTKLADDSVDSEHIVDGAVDLAHLAADSVDGTKIADDSVDSEHIVDGAVDNVHLANSTISGKALGTSLDALSQGAGIAAFSYDGSGTATVALSGSVAGEGLVFNSGVLSVAKSLKDVSNSNFNAAYGLNFQSGDMGSPVTGTLPTISSGDEGKSVIIKVRNADQQTVRVQSSQNIDGSSDDLLIESAGAAITLVAISAGAGWAII